jgi:hypothetical protein
MNVKIWIENEKTEAPCLKCQAWVDATYRYGTVHLEESGVDVEDVLVAVCDVCGETVGIPEQSVPKLKVARAPEKRRVPVRITRELDDVLVLLADRFGVDEPSFSSPLIRYYLGALHEQPHLRSRIARLSTDPIATTGTRKQKTIRVPATLLELAEKDMEEYGVNKTSRIVRGIIVAAKEDVFEKQSSKHAKALRQIAEVAS